MRAVPIMNPRPGMGRALPTPVVQSAIVKQVVDLKPAGNTVAIQTIADNPFEGRKRVSVVTQASGGMSPAPVSMQSKRLVHQRMSGLGETATKEQAKGPSTGEVVTNIFSTATQAYTGYTQQQIAESERKAAEAAARAQEWQARAAMEQSRTDRLLTATTANVGGFKFNWALMAFGVGLLGVALYMRQNAKK